MPMSRSDPNLLPDPIEASPRAPARRRHAVVMAAGLLFLPLLGMAMLPPGSDFGGIVEAGRADRARSAVPHHPVHVESADRLDALFERLDYDLDSVAEGAAPVPPVVLASLPPDLAGTAPVDRRKALFIRAALPIVMAANAAVMDERADLEALLSRVEARRRVPRELRYRFRRTAERYGLPEIALDPAGIRRLLRRVDGVPVSLALAQAISESGWGTSRFALSGNALFGQWTWDQAAGIVPAGRESGETHRVRAFPTLADSARAYLYNLNTHPAYAAFRKARATARAEDGDLPAGQDLARYLTRYSERGDAYVDDIVALIRQNRLARLDGATMGRTPRFADASAGSTIEG